MTGFLTLLEILKASGWMDPLVKKLSFTKKRNYEKTEAKRVEEKGYHPAYYIKLPPRRPRRTKEGAPAEPDSS
jgi:hypothetical protein